MKAGNEARKTCLSDGGSLAELSDQNIKGFLRPLLIETYVSNLALVQIYQNPQNRYFWKYHTESVSINDRTNISDWSPPFKGNLSSFRLYKPNEATGRSTVLFCYVKGDERRHTILTECGINLNGWSENFQLKSHNPNTSPGIQIYNYRFNVCSTSSLLFLVPLIDFKGFDIQTRSNFPNFTIPDISVLIGARSNVNEQNWIWNNGSIVTDEDYPAPDQSACQEMSMPLTYNDGINLRPKNCDSDQAYFVCKKRLFKKYHAVRDALYMFSSDSTKKTFAENTCSKFGGSLANLLNQEVKEEIQSIVESTYSSDSILFSGSSSSSTDDGCLKFQQSNLVEARCASEVAFFICKKRFTASLRPINCDNLTWNLTWNNLVFYPTESQTVLVTIKTGSSYRNITVRESQNFLVLRNLNLQRDELLVSLKFNFLPFDDISSFHLNATTQRRNNSKKLTPVKVVNPFATSSSGKCFITWSHNRSLFETIDYKIVANDASNTTEQISFRSSNYGLSSLSENSLREFNVTWENYTYKINPTIFLPNTSITFKITSVSDCGREKKTNVVGSCLYQIERPKLEPNHCHEATSLRLSWNNLKNIGIFSQYKCFVKATINQSNKTSDSVPFLNYEIIFDGLGSSTMYTVKVKFTCKNFENYEVGVDVIGSTGQTIVRSEPVKNLSIISNQGCFLEWQHGKIPSDIVVFKVLGDHAANLTKEDLIVMREQEQTFYKYQLTDLNGNLSFKVIVYERACERFSDSRLVTGQCHQSPNSATSSNTDLGAGLIAGISVGVLVLIAALLVLFIKKRDGLKCNTRDDTCFHNANNNPKVQIQESRNFEENFPEEPNRQGVSYVNVHPHPPKQKSETSVPVVDLEAFYANEKEKNFTKLKNQFKKLIQVSKDNEGPHSIASLQENAKLNRFKNIYPYDQDLVSLPSKRYINASHIKGFAQKSYIATQAPKTHTIDDLWEMIWINESPVIVMLCNCVENGKNKCEKYWPDMNVPLHKANLQIKSESVRLLGKITKRQFLLKNLTTQEQRTVIQFHYTNWPDHGTPVVTSTIVRLRILVNEEQCKSLLKGPIVVHCSAGVGRTGTYIAIDSHTEELEEKEREIDVYDRVLLMRKSRKDMVQNSDQYVFVHKVLAENCALPNTDYTAEELVAMMKKPDWKNIIARQFETLSRKIFQPSKHKKKQSASTSASSDDIGNIGNHQVIFYPRNTERKITMDAHYITCPYLPGNYIAAADPQPGRDIEFWEMILFTRTNIIVALERLPSNKLLLSKQPGSMLQYGEIVIQVQNVYETEMLLHHELLVTRQTFDQEFIGVSHILAKNDIDIENDRSCCSIIEEIIKKINSKMNEELNTVVYCRDGLTRTGIFLVTGNVFEQIKCGCKANVLQTLKDLREFRPRTLSHLNDFEKSYRIAKSYVSLFAVYANL